MCDCAMNCTVLCLRHCSGVHDLYGMYQGHECYQGCNHFCVVGCATRGVPSIADFIPNIKPQDYNKLIKSDSTITEEDFKNGLQAVDQTVAASNLIQDEDDEEVVPFELHLPTMD